MFCLPCMSARIGQLSPGILAIGQSMLTKITQLVHHNYRICVFMYSGRIGCVCIDG